VYELGLGEAIAMTPSPDGAPITTLRGATIRGGSAGASVRIEGAGHASIEGVVLELERGIAIGARGASVEVADTEITGNVDPEDVLELPVPAPPELLATYGVVALDGASAVVRGTSVSRVASAGIFCGSATLDVGGGVLSENRGIAMALFDCAATVTDLEIVSTLSAPSLPGMGIAASMSTVLTATRLSIHDAPGYGVLGSSSTVSLVDPRIARMEQSGAWAEGATSMTITGGVFESNEGAAIAAVGAARLEVRETSVTGTRSAPIPSAGGGAADTMADAIHVAQRSGDPSTIVLAGLMLADNDRVGIVLDGASEALDVTIERARVETTGAQLGAIAQNVSALPAGWDADVTRIGSAATLDPVAAPVVVSDGSGATGILMPPTITF
jgi:hypothetical protein